jgi:hypothetical protein
MESIKLNSSNEILPFIARRNAGEGGGILYYSLPKIHFTGKNCNIFTPNSTEFLIKSMEFRANSMEFLAKSTEFLTNSNQITENSTEFLINSSRITENSTEWLINSTEFGVNSSLFSVQIAVNSVKNLQIR